jgi:hypothetical protein
MRPMHAVTFVPLFSFRIRELRKIAIHRIRRIG